MALIIRGKSTCAICGKILADGDELVATTHFIPNEDDPLWRFSDAGMHYACFQEWEHREVFVSKYNSTIGQTVWGNGTRHHMSEDGIVESVPAEGT